MDRDLLVGSTGFVGGNLRAVHAFAALAHSTDVAAQYGARPQLCVYAGVPAAMFLANADPQRDLDVMRQARENLRRIAPERLVLVSSIAVYADSRGRCEDDEPDGEGLAAYGRNRLQLERWVREDFPGCLIVRLPALYGRGLKKNFLYDLHTIVPALLRPEKYAELSVASALVARSYAPAANGFYALAAGAERAALRAYFAQSSFNALSFTDSRSRFQFYPLRRLWGDICAALDAKLTVLNLTPPPLAAREVYRAVTGRDDWRNELAKPPMDYDLRSRHARLLNPGAGADGYLCSAAEELADIVEFMRGWRDAE